MLRMKPQRELAGTHTDWFPRGSRQPVPELSVEVTEAPRPNDA